MVNYLIVALNIAVLIEFAVLHVMSRRLIAKTNQALAQYEAAVQAHPVVREAEHRTGITFKTINNLDRREVR
ncbi:hypothetical protein GCM10009850_047970 [Nonomuraea monospora]|uniref:Uncharacterized protein n=1 Tax=Nonomuraea monospora TaxID=568818 RepID=A0ABN3CJ35_9ACTN